MSEFVSNDYANGSIIHGVIQVVIVEGGLKDSRHEVDIVLRRVIVGIDSRWTVEPLPGIDWLADLVELALALEFIAAKRIPHRIAPNNVQRAVVAPLVGIADLVRDLVQLDQGLSFGGLGHPWEIGDVAFQRFFQRIHHSQGALLAARSESALYEGLP